MKKTRKILFYHTGDSNSSTVEKLLNKKSLTKKNFSFTTIFSHDSIEPTLLVDTMELKGIDKISNFIASLA